MSTTDNSFSSATWLGTLLYGTEPASSVATVDSSDYYRFKVDRGGQIELSLAWISPGATANLLLYAADHRLLSSTTAGAGGGLLNFDLPAGGEYYCEVQLTSAGPADYSYSLQQVMAPPTFSLELLSQDATEDRDFVFRIVRSGEMSSSATVDWAVASSGGAGQADGADFGGALPASNLAPFAPVTFMPGQADALVTLHIAPDGQYEWSESFTVVLTGAQGGVIDPAASPLSGLIAPSDLPSAIPLPDSTTIIPSIASIVAVGDDDGAFVSRPEGGTYVFRVGLDSPAPTAGVVSWIVEAKDGIQNSDFGAGTVLPVGTVSFALGATAAFITLTAAADAVPSESSDTFAIRLTGATGGVTIDGAASVVWGVIEENGDEGDASLAVGLARMGRINTPSDVDKLTFNLSAGRSYAISAHPAEFSSAAAGLDPYLVLKDAGGNIVARSNNSNSTFGAQVAYTPTADGAYTLEVMSNSGASTGSYIVQSRIRKFDDFLPSGIGPDPLMPSVYLVGDINPEDVVAAGWVETPSDGSAEADLFRMRVREGQAYTFTISSPLAARMSAQILDAAGNLLDIVSLSDVNPSGASNYALRDVSFVVPFNNDATDGGFVTCYLKVVGETPAANQAFSYRITGGADDALQGGVVAAPEGFRIEALGGYVMEGDTGNTDYVFAVTREGANLNTAASVRYAVTANQADFGTLLPLASADDFTGTPFTGGVLSFAAGEEQKFVTIQVKGDVAADNPAEFFTVTLSPVGDTVPVIAGMSSAVGRILDDDGNYNGSYGGAYVFSISNRDGDTAEGSGSRTEHVFRVNLNRGDSLDAVATVHWAVGGEIWLRPGSVAAANPRDFFDGTSTVLPEGDLTFLGGETVKYITLAINGDSAPELNEAYSVRLSGPSVSAGGIAVPPSATIAGSYGDVAYSGIRNDDPRSPVVVKQNSRIDELGGGAVFTIVRANRNYSVGEMLAWRVVVPDAGATVDGDDFANAELPAGEIGFAPGQTSATLTIMPDADGIVDDNEGFRIEVYDPASGAVLNVTNSNDLFRISDVAPTVTLSAGSVVALGDTLSASDTYDDYRISLTSPGELRVTFASLTPGADVDLELFSVWQGNSFSLATGDNELRLNADSYGEYIVRAWRRSGAPDYSLNVSLAPAGTSVWIDPYYFDGQVAHSLYGIDEQAGQFLLAIRRSGTDIDATTTTASWEIAPNPWNGYSSASPGDFVGGASSYPSGVVSFAMGQDVVVVTVPVADDNLAEDMEDFVVRLTDVAGGQITDPIAYGSFSQSDLPASQRRVSIQPVSGYFDLRQFEANAGSSRDYVFRISLQEQSSYPAPLVIDDAPIRGSGYGTGSVDQELDPQDLYRVELASAGDVHIALSWASSSDDVNLVLLDATATPIAQSTGSGTVTESIATALAAGTYYVQVVAAVSAQSIDYSLDVTLPVAVVQFSDGPANDAMGDLPVVGQLSAATMLTLSDGSVTQDSDNVDYYRVHAANSGTMQVTLSGLTDDANLVLLDADGKYLAQSSSGGTTPDLLAWNVAAGADYYVRVSYSWSSTSAPIGYDLALSLQPQSAIVDEEAVPFLGILGDAAGISLGVTGSISDIDQADRFALEVASPGRIWLSLGSLTAAADLTLYDAGGNVVASSSNPGSEGESIVYDVSTAGTFFVGVAGVAAGIGDYRLDAHLVKDVTVGWHLDSANSDTSAADFVGGVVPSGQVTVNAINPYAFVTVQVAGDNANEGDESFHVTLNQDDPNLWYGNTSAQAEILNNDDDLLATTATSATLAVGGAAVSSIDSGDDRDWLRVSLVAGSTYFFEANSSQGKDAMSSSPAFSPLDPFLTLRDASGAVVAMANDFAGTNGARIHYTATKTETYYLDVSANPGHVASPGEYVVQSRLGGSAALDGATVGVAATDDYADNATTVGDISTNGLANGWFDRAGDEDWFRVRLEAGQQFSLGIETSPDVDLAVRLVDAAGHELAGAVSSSSESSHPMMGASVSDGYSRTGYTVTLPAGAAGGDYFLAIQGSQAEGKVRSYRLESQSAATDAGNRISLLQASGYVVEGNSGTNPYVFYVTREGDLTNAATVEWAVSRMGTASPLASASTDDFANAVLPRGTLSFAAGRDLALVTLSIVGDTNSATSEPDEYFNLTLSNPADGWTLDNSQVIGRIRNDDVSLATTGSVFSISTVDAWKDEGNGPANGAHVFRVNRTGSISGAASVAWAVRSDVVRGNFVDETDFAGTALPSGVVSFAANETSKFVTVTIAADARVEPNEGYAVVLATTNSGGSLASDTAYAGILNDDGSASFAIAGDLVAYEAQNTIENYSYGQQVRAGTMVLTVTRSGGSLDQFESATWRAVTSPGSGRADAGDFVVGYEVTTPTAETLPGGAITFQPGVSVATITIGLADDLMSEGSEAFQVVLTRNASTTLASTTVTILDGAPPVAGGEQTFRLQPFGAQETEGNGYRMERAESGAFVYTVLRSGDDLTAPAAIGWRVSNDGYGSMAVATDFVGGRLPMGTVNFVGTTAHSQLVQFTLAVLNDTVNEDDEWFNVVLTEPGQPGGPAFDRGEWGTVNTHIADDDDEFGNTNTTAGRLGILGSTSGTIDGASDEDRFKVSLVAGFSYHFAAISPANTLGIGLRLLNSAGSAVTGVSVESFEDDHGQVLSFTPNVSSDYYLSTASSTGQTGDYGLLSIVEGQDDAPNTRDQAQPLTTMGWNDRLGVIERPGDQDWFQVSLEAGHTYDFSLNHFSDFQAAISLYDQAGNPQSLTTGQVESILTVAEGGAFTPAASGVYFLKIAGAGQGDAGGYLLSLSDRDFERSVADTNNQPTNILVGVEAVASNIIENGVANQAVFRIRREGFVNSATTVVGWAVQTTGIAGDTIDGQDFGTGTVTLLPSGSVTFAPSDVEKFVTLAIAGDAQAFEDEVFRLQLGTALTTFAGSAEQTPSTVVLADNAWAGVRVHDVPAEYAIRLESGDASRDEGSAWVFRVTRNGRSDQPGSVNWTLQGATFGTVSSVASNSDIVAMGSVSAAAALNMAGAVSFAAGESIQFLTVASVPDNRVEADEGFRITLTAPSGATVRPGADTVALVISNDDERDDLAGSTRSAAYFLGTLPTAGSLVPGSGFNESAPGVGYVEDGASADADRVDYFRFVASASGALTLKLGGLAGADSTFAADADIDVRLEDGEGNWLASGTRSDNRPEEVNFSGLVGGQAYYVAVHARDGASPYTLSLQQPSVQASVELRAVSAYQNEGNPTTAATTPFVFEIAPAGTMPAGTVVTWTVGAAGDTVDAQDFQGSVLPSGSVTFAATGDARSRLVTINVAADSDYESNEQFTVSISTQQGSGVLVTQVTATGTILNDDVYDGAGNTFAAARALPLSAGSEISPALDWVGATDRYDYYSFVAPANGAITARISGLGADADLYVYDGLQNRLDSSVRGGSAADEVSVAVTLGQTYYLEVRQYSGDTNYVLDLSHQAQPAVYSIAATNATRAENADGAVTAFVFTVSRTDTTHAGTANWYLDIGADGTTANWDDFSGALSGQIAFAQGVASGNVTLSVLADSDTSEGDESFVVRLNSVTGGELDEAHQSALGLIQAGELPDLGGNSRARAHELGALAAGGTISIQDSVSPTDSNDYFKFSADFSGSVTLDLTGTGGSTFAAGSDVDVRVSSSSGGNVGGGFRASNEPEQFTFEVSAGQDYYVRVYPYLGESAYSLRLTAGAPRVWIEAAGAAQFEGTGQVFNVYRGSNTGTLSVSYGVETVTPASRSVTADDFVGSVLPAGTVSFAEGVTVATVTIATYDDALASEPQENFAVRLGSGEGFTLQAGGDVAVGTVLDNDLGFTDYRIDNLGSQTQAEGNIGSTPFVFAVRRTGNINNADQVSWSVAGSVTAEDFVGSTLPRGVVSFAAGDAMAIISLDVAGDTRYEADELFAVNLTLPSNTSLGLPSSLARRLSASSAGARITNDDQGMQFSISPFVTFAGEGDAEFSGDDGESMVFTISRTGDNSQSAKVAWTLNHLTSNAADLATTVPTAASIVTFAAGGSLTHTVTLTVKDDSLVEGPELFRITLSDPDAADGVAIDASRDMAWGVIEDNDLVVRPSLLSLNGAPVNHGEVAYIAEGGTTAAAITTVTLGISRSLDAGNDAVSWRIGFPTTAARPVAAETDDGVATASDFSGATSGYAVFDNGALSTTITLSIAGDMTAEFDEWFNVVVGETWKADARATATTPAGDDGAFVAQVRINNDDATLSGNPSLVTIGPLPTISVSGQPAEAPEGGSFVFSLRRSGSLDVASVVAYRLASGTAGTTIGAADSVDLSGPDLTGLRMGDLAYVTFAPGAAVSRVTVNTFDDSTFEFDEQFKLELVSANSTNAVITSTGGSATVTIRDNDPAPAAAVSFSGTDGGQLEGSAGTATAPGTTPFVFTIHRDSAPRSSTVGWAVQAHSSVISGDISGATSGTVTFNAFQTAATVTVNVKADYDVEADESFAVVLRDPVNARLGTTLSAQATIVNDDVMATLSVAADAAGFAEGNSGTTPFVFAVTRSGNVNLATSASWNLVSDGDTEPNVADFLATGTVMPSGSVSFAAGETAKTVTVGVRGDTSAEADERFRVMLTAGANAALGNGSATALIYNDDSISFSLVPTLATLVESSDVENRAAYTPFVFRLTREGLSDGANVTSVVDWRVVTTGILGATANTLADAEDFVGFAGTMLPSGSVVFGAGVGVQTITLNVADDALYEPDPEQFRLLVVGNGVTYTAMGSISPDAADTPLPARFALSAVNSDLLEGNAGTTAYTFQVTRSGDMSQAWTLGWHVAGNDSTIGYDDFGTGGIGDLPFGRVTFLPNQSLATITVGVRGDAKRDEGDETFVVSLDSGPNAVSNVTPAASKNLAATYEIAASVANAIVRDDDGVSIPDYAGNDFAAAREFGVFSATTRSATGDTVGNELTDADGLPAGIDTADYYRFNLASAGSISLSLSGITVTADADVYLYRWQDEPSTGVVGTVDDGETALIGQGTNAGNASESIALPYVDAGDYFILVSAYRGATPYNLTLASRPVPDNAGNTLAAAKALTLGAMPSVMTDFVGGQDSSDYYKFTIGAASRVELGLSGMSDDADLRLLNAAGQVVATSTLADSADDLILLDSLAAGTYYVLVSPWDEAATFYNLSAAAETLEASNRAYNTPETARTVALPGTVAPMSDAVGLADPADYYKFTLRQTADISLGVTGIVAGADVDVELLDSNQNRIAASTTAGNAAEGIVASGLAGGTYYVRVYQVEGASAYSLGLKGTAVSRPDSGGNVGSPVNLGTLGTTLATVSDYVGSEDTADFFKFSVGSGRKRLAVNLTGMAGDLDVVVLDANGNALDAGHYLQPGVGYDSLPGAGQSVSEADESFDILFGADPNAADGLAELRAGDYYLKVVQGDTQPNSSAYRLEVMMVEDFDADAAAPFIVSARGIPEGGGYLIQNLPSSATPTRILVDGSGVTAYTDFVGTLDSHDYYRFSLAGPRNLRLTLDGITADANLELLNSNGQVVASSNRSGNSAESISSDNLAAGQYYVHVQAIGNANTRYSLNMTALAPTDNAGNLLTGSGTAGPKTITLAATPAVLTDYVGSDDGAGDAVKDTADLYKFTLSAASTVSFKLASLTGAADMQLFTLAGSGSTASLVGLGSVDWTSINKTGTEEESFVLPGLARGTYVLKVAPEANQANVEAGYTLSAWGITSVPTDSAGAIASVDGQVDDSFVVRAGTLRLNTADAYKNEGTATTPYLFNIYRDGDLSQPASATWTVTPAGSTDNTDFANSVVPGGTVTFAANASLATITVNVRGDAVNENVGEDLFNVSLLGSSANVIAVHSEVTGRIRNDDAGTVKPTASVYAITPVDLTKTEGASGVKATYVFNIYRDGPSLSAAETVQWGVESIASQGFATVSAADFGTAFPGGLVTFTGNQTLITRTIDIAGDDLLEPDEYFKVTLSAPSNLTSTLANASFAGVIRSDEASSTLAPKAVTLTTAVQTVRDFVSYSSAGFGDEDWYKITLGNVTPVVTGNANSGGGRIEAKLSGLVGNADLTLYMASTVGGVTTFTKKAESANGGTLDEAILSDNLATGTYYLRVSPAATAGTVSGYALNLRQVARDDYVASIEAMQQPDASVGSLALTGTGGDRSGSLRGSVELPGDTDWFRMHLTPGTYSFAARGKAGTSDTVNTLTDTVITGIYNSGGTLLANSTGDDSVRTSTSGNTTQSVYSSDAQVTLEITDEGDYYVAATAYGTLTGSYTLAVSSRNEAPLVTNPIADQEAPEGSPFVLRLPWNVFQDPEGRPLTLTATLRDGSALPSWLTYEASAQMFVGTPPASSGTYDIRLRATDPGFDGIAGTTDDNKYVDDTFTIRTPRIEDDYAAAVTTSGTVQVGGSRRGEIETTYDVDWIRVSLNDAPSSSENTAGVSYTFNLRGTSGSSRLADPMIAGIYDATGTRIDGTSNDDFGDSVDARVTFTTRNDGDGSVDTATYYVAVTGAATNRGAYELSVATGSGDGNNQAPRYNHDGDHQLPDHVDVREGSVFTYTVPAAIFTDDETLAYSAKQSNGEALPSWLRFDAATRTFNTGTTTAPANIGDLDVRITATDTYGLSVSRDLVLRTVGAGEGQEGTWTIMVYLAADNDLEQYALKDLNEMESATLANGVRVVVMVDRHDGYSTLDGDWKDTRRGLIRQDNNLSSVTSLTSANSVGELDTGSPTTLTDFINWSASNYRADNYGLVVWDHGGGLSGTSWDFTSNRSNLSVAETTNAIANSVLEEVDFLGFDTCLQGMIEQAVDVREVADFVVASQDLEPGDGWDYSRWLSTFATNANPTKEDLATAAVNAYATAYQNSWTLSAVDTDRLGALVTKINDFISATEAGSDGDWLRLKSDRLGLAADQASNATAVTVTNFNRNDYLDLGAYMDAISHDTGVSSQLQSAAAAVSQALDAAVIAQTQVANASGLSVFLPASAAAANAGDYTSANFSFLSDTRWSSFVQNLASHA